MFANVGWGEMLVLVLIGLVVLGPERLPGAIRWTATALRQARDYLSNATSQLREEIGPEFDDLRAPLSELQKLRGMSPRSALTKHLFDGDDSLFTAVSQLAEEPDAGRPPATESSGASGSSESSAPLMSGFEGPTPFDRDAT